MKNCLFDPGYVKRYLLWFYVRFFLFLWGDERQMQPVDGFET